MGIYVADVGIILALPERRVYILKPLKELGLELLVRQPKVEDVRVDTPLLTWRSRNSTLKVGLVDVTTFYQLPQGF